jgi:hypothetical protein
MADEVREGEIAAGGGAMVLDGMQQPGAVMLVLSVG